MRFPALLGIWASLIHAGCIGCPDAAKYEAWNFDSVSCGTVSAPPELNVPAQLGNCTPQMTSLRPGGSTGIQSCMEGNPCYPSLAWDTGYQAGLTQFRLYVSARAIIDGQPLTLPSPSVSVAGDLITPQGDPILLTLVSGTLSFMSLEPDFDARLDVVLETPDGKRIQVTGARYAWLNGYLYESCLAS